MKILSLLALALLVGACSHAPDRDYRYDDKYGYGDRYDGKGGVQGSELICHKGKKTMELPSSAVGGHLGHGDYRGPCR